jgi:calcineurin-like phosphoesterase family protein
VGQGRGGWKLLLLVLPLVVAAVSRGGAPAAAVSAPCVVPAESATFQLRAPLVKARAQAGEIQLVLADPRNAGRPLTLGLPSPRCARVYAPRRRHQLQAARSSFVAACGKLSSSFSPLEGSATVKSLRRAGKTRPLFGFTSMSCGGAPEATLVAAGDIARCGTRDDSATAKLVAGLSGTVATLGDNAYESGTWEDYTRCYAPTWGRVKARTRPAPGNHEYETPGAAPYFRYFGAAAGPGGKGYYSYDLGRWHVVVVNSNCGDVGGCGEGSPQGRWLRSDLNEHVTPCTLAYWHHPRFSSGTVHGSTREMTAIWRILDSAGADVVLSGHEHNYERFAPQTPEGNPDGRTGIREFVVGTGGRTGYPFGKPLPTSEVRLSKALGVLRLQLHPAGYDWRFFSVAGRSFSDRGSGGCH